MLSLSATAQTRSPYSSNILPKNGDQNGLSFPCRPTYPDAGKVVQFTDSLKAQTTFMEWDFGDGSTSTVRNPNHSFSAVRTYNVTLMVTNSACTNSKSVAVSIGLVEAIKAASPSFEDVKSAIARARAGDTVLVPAGTATWNRPLVITKGIKLIGAGIGQTVITGNYAATGDYFQTTYYLISYAPANPALNEPFRLSGFTFNSNYLCYGLMLKNLTNSPITKVRVDHCKFVNQLEPKGVGLWVYGHVYGVIDNSEVEYVRTFGLDANSWTYHTFDYGTPDNFYVEDCTIAMTVSRGTTINHILAYGEGGSRYCFRHNDITVAAESGFNQLFDAHGNQPSHHGTAGVEVYDNVINAQNKDLELGQLRGGKGLFYNNIVFNSHGSVWLKIREEYLDSISTPSSNVISGQSQHVSDSYFWGNRYAGGASRLVAYVGEALDYGGTVGVTPRANAHFWDENPSFDGTTGVGVGLLADRPTTCTKGVAFWATDTKTLYKCTATNVWTEFYKPYPYPHPLRSPRD